MRRFHLLNRQPYMRYQHAFAETPGTGERAFENHGNNFVNQITSAVCGPLPLYPRGSLSSSPKPSTNHPNVAGCMHGRCAANAWHRCPPLPCPPHCQRQQQPPPADLHHHRHHRCSASAALLAAAANAAVPAPAASGSTGAAAGSAAAAAYYCVQVCMSDANGPVKALHY